METRAYDESYLPYVMANLAEMFDVGINLYGIQAEMFYSRFLTSGIARQIELGNPNYLAGHSGHELAEIVVERSGGGFYPQVDDAYSFEKSPEYWAGWILAQYQWQSCRSFAEISRSGLPISKIIAMYHPLHEANPSKFCDMAENILAENSRMANPLKDARARIGITQGELSEISGVSLRMIRAYEQKRQDISKAEYNTVLRLSRALKVPANSLVR